MGQTTLFPAREITALSPKPSIPVDPNFVQKILCPQTLEPYSLALEAFKGTLKGTLKGPLKGRLVEL